MSAKFIEKPWFGNLLSMLLLPFVHLNPLFSGIVFPRGAQIEKKFVFNMEHL